MLQLFLIGSLPCDQPGWTHLTGQLVALPLEPSPVPLVLPDEG